MCFELAKNQVIYIQNTKMDKKCEAIGLTKIYQEYHIMKTKNKSKKSRLKVREREVRESVRIH